MFPMGRAKLAGLRPTKTSATSASSIGQRAAVTESDIDPKEQLPFYDPGLGSEPPLRHQEV